MELSLLEIWESMGLLARGVAIFLVLMGIASFAVTVERWLVLRRANRTSAAFAGKARVFLEERLPERGAVTTGNRPTERL